MQNKTNVLLIGEVPPPHGGVTNLVALLLDELQHCESIHVDFLDSIALRKRQAWDAVPRFILPVIWFLRFIWKLTVKIPRADVVSLQIVTTKLWIEGPIVYVFCMIFRKPFIIRKFGGTDYYKFTRIKRWLCHLSIKKCNVYFAETKELVQTAHDNGISHVQWFPNHRKMPVYAPGSRFRNSCRRFVYMGQVQNTKGIRETLKAISRFDTNVTVDFYGPLRDGLKEDNFAEVSNANYCGTFEGEQVFKILEQYDALILASYHAGEGYPGAIFEAYGAGIPVIATHWRALPEIVNDDSGLLVAPRSVDELYEAMKLLAEDTERYQKLCRGAAEEADKYTVEHWADVFIETCHRLSVKKV